MPLNRFLNPNTNPDGNAELSTTDQVRLSGDEFVPDAAMVQDMAAAFNDFLEDGSLDQLQALCMREGIDPQVSSCVNSKHLAGADP